MTTLFTDADGVISHTPFLRSAYNYDMDAASVETGHNNDEPSMTQQNFKEETDINNILQKFGQGQDLPESFSTPQHGDFTGVNDYHQALNLVRQAGESFHELPAPLRSKFNNDAGQLLDFLDNPENRAEAEKLGLLTPPPQPTSAGASSPLPVDLNGGMGGVPPMVTQPQPKPDSNPTNPGKP